MDRLLTVIMLGSMLGLSACAGDMFGPRETRAANPELVGGGVIEEEGPYGDPVATED